MFYTFVMLILLSNILTSGKYAAGPHKCTIWPQRLLTKLPHLAFQNDAKSDLLCALATP